MDTFTKSTTPSKPVPYLVKHLRLRVEKLVFSDFAGSKPMERTYILNIDQTYTNVSDWRQLLVPKLMTNVKIGMIEDMLRLFPGNFSDAFSGAFKSLGVKLKEANDKAAGFFKRLFSRHPAPSPTPAPQDAAP